MNIKSTAILFIAMAFHIVGSAQNVKGEFLIQHYLQDAEPNSIKIMWETSMSEESIVEWGLTPKLGKKTKGI
ncbi:unnamed protein product, partial [Scytosiphon promiscuus]